MSTESYKYLQRWNFTMRKPAMNEPFIGENEARARYDTRSDWFTVVPGHPGLGETTETMEHGRIVPEFVIEVAVSKPDFKVFFCNPVGSIWRNIWYQNVDGRLFKARVVDYTYPDQEVEYRRSDCTILLTGHFKPDGYAAVEINDKSNPTVEFTEFRDVPVEGNWMDVPEFGVWGPLTDPDYDATRK